MIPTYSLATMADDDDMISITLDEECPECDGRGMVASFETETFATCAHCKAMGVVPTLNGEELLRFVRRYATYGLPELDQ